MSEAKIRTYALFGFSESGRSNLVCVTQAENDYAAAKKLGGQLVEPPELAKAEMVVYGMRLPPSPSGVAWGQFRFESDAAIESLAETTEPAGHWFNSVRNVGKNSHHLVLAEVPFLK